MNGGAIAGPYEFIPPLTESKKEGERNRADDEPGGWGHLRQCGASQDPQNEAGGNQHNVQDDHMLDLETIDQV